VAYGSAGLLAGLDTTQSSSHPSGGPAGVPGAFARFAFLNRHPIKKACIFAAFAVAHLRGAPAFALAAFRADAADGWRHARPARRTWCRSHAWVNGRLDHGLNGFGPAGRRRQGRHAMARLSLLRRTRTRGARPAPERAAPRRRHPPKRDHPLRGAV